MPAEMDEILILVDHEDNETGYLDKLSVHQSGLLHRAFSIFIFNPAGELLLQQRAFDKYHSPGLWSNTCCSHPRRGESTSDACRRRLMEEMGISCPLEFVFSFVYKAGFENGLTEHEYDHVYFGKSDQVPRPDPAEVNSWKFMRLESLEKELSLHPEDYSQWLRLSFPQVMQYFKGFTGHQHLLPGN